jgi:hypothetical protein
MASRGNGPLRRAVERGRDRAAAEVLQEGRLIFTILELLADFIDLFVETKVAIMWDVIIFALMILVAICFRDLN